MVNLTRVGFDPEDALGDFTSAAMVLDQDRTDSHKGKVVAVVFYSPGGNIIYKHDPDYRDEEILVAGEKYVGETFAARRLKVFNCAVVSPKNNLTTLDLKTDPLSIEFSPIPKNCLAKVGSFVSASGVVEVERRHIELRNHNGTSIFNFEDLVGLFTGEKRGSNFANVETDLSHLNGCEVVVKIEVIKAAVPETTTT